MMLQCRDVLSGETA